LVHYLVQKKKQNKSYATDNEKHGSQKAVLSYKLLARSDRYFLLEIDLKTGRHHQIRCQLAKIGCPVKGDLKYGFDRSNKDGGICLHSREISFIHPVSKKTISINAPIPDDKLWKQFERELEEVRRS
jgi:23S rRNA pseudouridine1911/1915/1917 synthase